MCPIHRCEQGVERVRDLARLVQHLNIGSAVPRTHTSKLSFMAVTGKICAVEALEKSLWPETTWPRRGCGRRSWP